MQIRILLHLTILFFMQASCMELAILPVDSFSTLPPEILKVIIAQNLTSKDLYNCKQVSRWFNKNTDYWMINPTIIKNEDPNVCTNGLIHFKLTNNTKNYNLFLQHGHQEITQPLTLLENDNNILKKSVDFDTILSNSITLRIASNLYPNIQQEKDGTTILHWACYQENYIVIKQLLKNGADVKTTDKMGNTALLESISYNNVNIIKLLLKYGSDPNMRNNIGIAPLIHACFNNNISIITLLLKHNADPNILKIGADRDLYYCPLMIACHDKNILLLKTLLECPSIDPNIQSVFGYTTLEYAYNYNNIEMIQLLLNNKKTNPNVQNRDGDTILHLICKNGQTDIAKIFLSNALCKTDISNKVGFFPIHYACQEGHENIVKLLLDTHNDNCNRKTANGLTPYNIAKIYKYEKIAQLILDTNKKNSITASPDNCTKAAPETKKNIPKSYYTFTLLMLILTTAYLYTYFQL